MQRHVYRAVATLGLVCLAAAAAVVTRIPCADASPAESARGAGSAALEGTWRERVTVPPNPNAPDGLTFDTRLTFSRGGGLVETDNNPATPEGGTALGVWEKTGANTFVLTFEKFAFNPIKQAPGVFKVVSVVHLDGDAFTGESPAAYFCDADGSNCVLLGPATSVGTRMQVELP